MYPTISVFPEASAAPDDPVRFRYREAHGFLDEHVPARIQRGDGRFGLGVGEAQQHGVQVQSEEVFVPGDAAAFGHVVEIANEVDELRGRVAEPGQFVAVAQFRDMGQMLYLGDRTRSRSRRS